MVGSYRDFLRVLLLLPAAWLVACATGEAPVSITTSAGGGGMGGMGGGDGGVDLGPCGLDCSKIQTPQCAISVCNTGQVLGPLNTCVVVPAPDGTSCDDGKFCTSNDVCSAGACVGGEENRCGAPANPCVSVICYEDSQTCDTTPANDGATCTPANLCLIDGVCQIGECVGGNPKDCSFSPLSECNLVSCNPNTGKCEPTPDPNKDDQPCILTGDFCSVNRTCKTGQCQGGTPKDCSALDVGCQVGVCDSDTGLCGGTAAPVGTSCSEGIPECHVGACDVKGACIPSEGQDGASCNDHNACTKADTCSAGVCGGTALAGCVLYFQEGFETCPDGWTLSGDWQCGTPTNVGPATAHTGTNVVATKIGGVYSVNQSYDTCTADSPAIDLTAATNPMVSFWVWDHTEGGTFDGWNLKASKDGAAFTQVAVVSPAYNLNVASQPAWGGDHSAASWQNYTADLSAFKGGSVKLRFAFHSDGATVYPGVYLDDLVVAEPAQIPLYISSTSPLTDVYVGMSYSAKLTRTGGTPSAVWSITSGPPSGWLTINSATGELTGTPKAGDAGPVTVKVHVEDSSTNYADKTFTFNVIPDVYYTSFEGACPNGWTLTGDWQCGVPTSGPGSCYLGTQCMATQLAGNYSDLDTYAGNTATSPDIDLTNSLIPQMTFRMWLDTEGGTHDGVNLQISTDGGATYSVLTSVTPAYPLTIAGAQAWGGQQHALGWQPIAVDLAAYAGQVIRLRFAFRSDSSGNFPGVYIDDIFVN